MNMSPLPMAGNQAEVEKSTTGTNSPNPIASEVNHTEDVPQSGLLETNTNIQQQAQDSNWQCWTQEEYKGVMEAYYSAQGVLIQTKPTSYGGENILLKGLTLMQISWPT